MTVWSDGDRCTVAFELRGSGSMVASVRPHDRTLAIHHLTCTACRQPARVGRETHTRTTTPTTHTRTHDVEHRSHDARRPRPHAA